MPNRRLLRVGAFPNITHAQAMVGKANGFFDKAMGPQVKVQWTSFNAGPAAIEEASLSRSESIRFACAGRAEQQRWIQPSQA